MMKSEGWPLVMPHLGIGASFLETPGPLLAGPRLTTSINARGKGGRTPLMAAVGRGSVEVARELVMVEGVDLETRDDWGRSLEPKVGELVGVVCASAVLSQKSTWCPFLVSPSTEGALA